MVGNRTGIVMERANGDILTATSSPMTILKSTDGGLTWTQKFSETHPNRNARLNFESSVGDLFYGSALTDNNAKIYRSADGGETWTTVLTCDSDSAWYMIERNNGDLYLNEYNSSNTTHFAYNIWKSTDRGVTWNKFYTHPPGNDPQNINDRTMRHFHCLARDANDQMYLSMAHGLQVGTYLLNNNGTLGANIGDYYTGNASSKGGGLTSFVLADDGSVFFGPDNYPSGIYKYHPELSDQDQKLELVYDVKTILGAGRESFILGMSKGRYGVLYALGNGTTANQPFLLMSPDNGVSWVHVKINSEVTRPTFASVSRSSKPRVYIDQGINKPFLIIPDYDKSQLKALAS
jgi:hypothetical protein